MIVRVELWRARVRAVDRQLVVGQVTDYVVRHGCVDGLKLQRAAEATGLSLWQLRYHFDNSQGLLRAVAVALKSRIVESLAYHPAPAGGVIEAIRHYTAFVANVMASGPYRDFTYLMIRNGSHQPWLVEMYERQIAGKIVRSLEATVRAAGERSGTIVLLREGAARSFVRRIESGFAITALLPPIASKMPEDFDGFLRSIVRETFEATYAFEWSGADAA